MITDEQLIEDADLFTRVWGRRYTINRKWRDDLHSEVYIALHEARERFDPEKASWKYYAGLRSKSAVIDWLRKRIPYEQRNAFIIDIEADTEDDNFHKPYLLESNDDLTYLELKDLLEDVKPNYREVILCLISGYDQTEIAERLHLSTHRIGEMVGNIRRGLAHENLR